ncbi:hypothetical protein [Micromonospora sp. CA-248212]|uniref:hypothetical protein n=1 Tax=Micromonospora sp. CA-248212 TaxID=3239961 RepID=UPI003D8C9CEF
MSFWNRLKQRRNEQIEQRRQEAMAKAMARGATPEEVVAGERAARGNTAAVLGAIST